MSTEYTLVEDDPSTFGNLLAFIRDGYRVKANGKMLWPGLGNRSGLHSFANDLLMSSYRRGVGRFLNKIVKLPNGTEVEVFVFRNKTRDTGRWTSVRKLKLGACDREKALEMIVRFQRI